MLKQPADEINWGEFRKYFNHFIVGDVEKSLQADIEIGTIILTTIGIECLSGYYAGKETERLHFVDFMKEFMPAYATYTEDIYTCVRNGLAHDYVIKRNQSTNRSFAFTRNLGEPHLAAIAKDSNIVYLNRERYAKDFLAAQLQYFRKAESDQTYWDKAMRRIKNSKGFITVVKT